MRHAVNIVTQSLSYIRIGEKIDARSQHRKRRPQLMRGIGREVALNAETFLEAIKALVDRGD
jgi:hypothetical protein